MELTKSQQKKLRRDPSYLIYLINVHLGETMRLLLLLICDMYQRYVKWSGQWDNVSPSQKWLGKQLGITREWTNKLLAKLCLIGLMKKITRKSTFQRDRNFTCIYVPNPLISRAASKIRERVHTIKEEFNLLKLLTYCNRGKTRLSKVMWKLYGEVRQLTRNLESQKKEVLAPPGITPPITEQEFHDVLRFMENNGL